MGTNSTQKARRPKALLALLLSACVSACAAGPSGPDATAPPAPAGADAKAHAEAAADPARAGGCPAPADLVMVIDQQLFDESLPSALVIVEHAFDDGGPKGLLPPGTKRRALGEHEARKLGLPVSAGPVWVLADEKRGPCRLEAAERFVVVGDDPWETTPLVVTGTTGTCASERGDFGRLAVRRDAEPVRCTVALPKGVDQPIVESDAAPPEARSGFDPSTCRKPSCDLRTGVAGFASSGRRLEWSVATHVLVDPATDECHWLSNDFMALLVQDGPRSRVTRIKTEGLDEILLEDGAIVGFIDRNTERYDAYTWPRGGEPAKVATKQFFWAHEEDREVLTLGPYCGP
jgi:hypothetical protein